MPDYELKTALNKVGKKRMNFALLKGAEGNQVVISAKPVSPKMIAEVEEEIGESKRIAKGICFQEGDALVFATKSSPSPSWETVISKIFKDQQCAKFLPVAVRQLGETESDEASEEEETEETAAPPSATTVPLAPFEAPSGQVPPAPPLPPDSQPPGTDQAKTAKLQEALQKLTPAVKARIIAYPSRKDEVLRLVQTIQSQIKSGTLDLATDSLKQLATLLQSLGAKVGDGAATVPPPPPPPVADAPAQGDGAFRASWETARETFEKATEVVDAQIDRLQGVLRGSDDEELREIAEYGFNGLTGNLRVPLQAAIRDVSAAPDDAVKASAKKTLKLISQFRQHINTEERIEACDENPLGVPVAIRSTYNPALKALETALSRA